MGLPIQSRKMTPPENWPIVLTLTNNMQQRAMSLTVRVLGTDLWEVYGGEEPHEVSIKMGLWHCDCKSFEHRAMCSHIGAVLAKGWKL